MPRSSRNQTGFTVIELLISLAIAALLLAAMSGLVRTVDTSRNAARTEVNTLADARFAMQRMVAAVLGTQRLLLPLADNPATNWRENVREQTEPPSAPDGDSTRATAVLAVTLDPGVDVDGDGFADADNDKDGKADEDFDDDNTSDGQPGIIGIDDDGDGAVDETGGADAKKDDDEDGLLDEDPVDGVDNDNDGAVDEDPPKDINDDSRPGVIDVDDDGDGTIDEGSKPDDDEDGVLDEDRLDAHVFFFRAEELIERRPSPNGVDGTDWTEHVIAENVTRFRVERISDVGKRAIVVDITLEITPEDGPPVRLNTRARVGGGQ